MERLYRLFECRYGARPSSVNPLTGSASPRNYYRMSGADSACVGVVGTDVKENEAFIALAGHFRSKGINVPEVYGVSDDGMAYIQEDLGENVLFDEYAKARKNGEGLGEVEELLVNTVRKLPEIQFKGAEGLDFSVCHPQEAFSSRSAMFDLNYFKYCFLKPTGLEFHEMMLQDDFERFAHDLSACDLISSDGYPAATFLMRDCQSRNVMIRDGVPYFIDFQSGRRGPVYYDVASFIWHARADYSDALKERMLDAYLESLTQYVDIDREEFLENLRLFRLFRCLQVLGAYGFRGWVEKKANFVVSIPKAVKALAGLLEKPFHDYPYMMQVLEKLVNLPRFAADEGDGCLEVKVYSFSFRKGIPEDPSGNGGGYVFDCRAIHNPGRYESYKHLTGRDEEVVRFLEEDGGVSGFLEHVYGVLDPHIEAFMSRGFTSLMLSFGCTGGQHRSVYCAEQAARHIVAKYPQVRVRLIHREQNITELFDSRHDA